MRILIIDDDREDTDLFCEALTDIFPEAICTTRNNCHNIIPFLEGIPAQDVIFIDGHLSNLTGLDCLKQMKESIPEKTRIVVHTGSLSPGEIQEFRIAGIDEIMIKANSYELLKLNLKELLTTESDKR